MNAQNIFTATQQWKTHKKTFIVSETMKIDKLIKKTLLSYLPDNFFTCDIMGKYRWTLRCGKNPQKTILSNGQDAMAAFSEQRDKRSKKKNGTSRFKESFTLKDKVRYFFSLLLIVFVTLCLV